MILMTVAMPNDAHVSFRYASWMPASEPGASPPGRSFEPCRADCSTLADDDLTYVRVNFDDVQKLRAAFMTNAKLREADQFYGATTTTWGIADNKPVAGWNLCSRDKTEHGFFDYVCVFDADESIDGQPYRTTELDYTESAFGGSAELWLFTGNWELRIAYDGWALAQDMQIACVTTTPHPPRLIHSFLCSSYSFLSLIVVSNSGTRRSAARSRRATSRAANGRNAIGLHHALAPPSVPPSGFKGGTTRAVRP